jgi:hypothetical protein
VNFGLISLDQNNAFDRVDHKYLFNVMYVFGFGKSFLTCVKLLYAGVSCMANFGGGLSRPVCVRLGIRQGCPLLGQLYTLAIEPLLGLLCRRLQGVCWTGMGEGPPMFPPLQVTAETGNWQGGQEDLLDLKTPSLGRLKEGSTWSLGN